MNYHDCSIFSVTGCLGLGESARGGEPNVSCDLERGGGETYCRVAPSKTSFGGLRKWDSSGLCPFPLGKMTWHDQEGERIISGGVQKPFLGRGFMVCFPLL